MVSFLMDAGLKPLSPVIDGPVNDFLPAFWLTIHHPGAVSARWCRMCASAKHSLEESPNSVVDWILVGILGGQTSGEWNQEWPDANTRRWHVHDGQVGWISTGLGLWKCAGCHGNSCSWYSAVWIIFMVNYQVMLQEQFDQIKMILILVDVCESYWP